MAMLIPLDLDWNATAVVVAIILAALGAVVSSFAWAFHLFKARVEEQLLNADTAAKNREAELGEQLALLAEQMQSVHALDKSWDPFVECLGECVVALSNRQEWHAGLLSRALDPGRAEVDKEAAMRADRGLADEFTPRMHEIFLFQGSKRVRANAARTLADGVGDHKTVARMQALALSDDKLKRPLERLLKRLGENGHDQGSEGAKVGVGRPEPTSTVSST